MLGFLTQRLLQAVIVMLAISMLVFAGVFAVGNPIDVLISPDATQQIRLDTTARYGLDQPLWKQYAAFLGRLLQGDFGKSIRTQRPGASGSTPVVMPRRKWSIRESTPTPRAPAMRNPARRKVRAHPSSPSTARP